MRLKGGKGEANRWGVWPCQGRTEGAKYPPEHLYNERLKGGWVDGSVTLVGANRWRGGIISSPSPSEHLYDERREG